MSTGSTPSVRQHLSNESADGCDLGLNAASLVGMHGAATIQQVAHATPTDLATALTNLIAINLALKNKGITN